MKTIRRLRVAAFMAVLLLSNTVNAQTTSGVEADVQFDFSLPGARSLGVGGAFAAVADDATAALANPAGLTNLLRREVSFEGRGWNHFTTNVLRGHAPGMATGVGVDTITGAVDATVKDTTAGVGFLSFVYPTGDWAFAGYRQQLVKLINSFQSDGLFVTTGEGVSRTTPSESLYELDVAGYGFAVARELGGNVSVGASVNVYDFSLQASSTAYVAAPVLPEFVSPVEAEAFTGTGEKFGPSDFRAGNAFFNAEHLGDDVGWGVNAGVLWAMAERWSLGASFRQGPRFTFDSTFGQGPAHPLAPNLLLSADSDIEFNVPDTYSIGIAHRPIDVFLLTLQVDQVQYSQMLNGDGNGRPVETTGRFSPTASRVARENGEALVAGLERADATQVRFGGEWAAVRSPVVVLLRLGGWFDPDHSLTFMNPFPDRPALVRADESLEPRPDEWHFSGGGGLGFEDFQIDVAFDLSERLNTYSVSGVVYF